MAIQPFPNSSIALLCSRCSAERDKSSQSSARLTDQPVCSLPNGRHALINAFSTLAACTTCPHAAPCCELSGAVAGDESCSQWWHTCGTRAWPHTRRWRMPRTHYRDGSRNNWSRLPLVNYHPIPTPARQRGIKTQTSGHPESNQGPSDCCKCLQSDALPTELCPEMLSV